MRYAQRWDDRPFPAERCGWRRRPSLMATALAACGGGDDSDGGGGDAEASAPKAPATIPSSPRTR